MNKSVAEYREMEEKTLTAEVSHKEQELIELREAVRTGKEKNHARLRVVKSDIARAKTILKEKSNKANANK